ncbi:MAG: hypothetical protein KA419_14700, partial [Acidobacteria bacterium]|nr:hypothetical protein [Acidobacteriota bacterium]
GAQVQREFFAKRECGGAPRSHLLPRPDYNVQECGSESSSYRFVPGATPRGAFFFNFAFRAISVGNCPFDALFGFIGSRLTDEMCKLNFYIAKCTDTS